MSARPLVVGFVAGASACAACFAGYHLSRERTTGGLHIQYMEPTKNETVRAILNYGIPKHSPEVFVYKNHVLRYDQERRIPHWVAERITSQHIHGEANRRKSKFVPDPSVSEMFTAHNEDYWNSGWSRGHLAPAGNNKHDQSAMDDTFLLSNVVPQDLDNNSGFWNRLEMYCRELTKRYNDVYIISGPLFLPCSRKQDGKLRKIVQYEVLGKSEVAVPTHLFKIIIGRRVTDHDECSLAAFVVPNEPISKEHTLLEYQVPLEFIESKMGHELVPLLDRSQTKNLCEEDGCKLIPWDQFQLYFISRKVESANTLHRLEKVWKELEQKKLKPDSTLLAAYQTRRSQLEKQDINMVEGYKD